MPNHVINELVFHDVPPAKQAEILAVTCDSDGKVDFNILVPAPLNMWMGNVGERHQKAFKRTHLDWARENWGTKWNAYDHWPTAQTESGLTLAFETAWEPPYPWLAAVFNSQRVSFTHHWLSEGGGPSTSGKFDYTVFDSDGLGGDPWSEAPATGDVHRHLHKLLWGVEEFVDEDA